MPRLETLSELNRNVLQSFPCVESDTLPWQALHQALSASTLALVTSAGLHLKDDIPFVTDPKQGDTSYRMIPSTATASEIVQSYTSIGFDRTAIYCDLNVSFPMDRLRELVDKGVIGRLAPHYYSFMGALRNPRGMIEDSGPEVTPLRVFYERWIEDYQGRSGTGAASFAFYKPLPETRTWI